MRLAESRLFTGQTHHFFKPLTGYVKTQKGNQWGMLLTLC